MIIKYHDLEAYYLNRRLELLQRLNDCAEQSLYDEDYEMNDFHTAIEMLKEQYSDVIDPSKLNDTLKRIYPDDLYSIEKTDRTKRKMY